MEGVVNPLAALRGRRVLVIGDTGFKGSWLALWLSELGADVHGYALPPVGAADHYAAVGLANLIAHEDGDIRNFAHLRACFARVWPQCVFHLAAQPLVRRSYDDPRETFETNVGGSVNVLECVRETESVRSLIYVTSDKCYENREWTWGYRENDRLGGRDPYSASKAAAEIVFQSYRDSYFSGRPDCGVASVRAGNVIGGGDWSEDRIVPDSIRSLQASQPIRLRRPLATRPWQHVLEPLSGYLLLTTKLLSEPGRFSGAWNFGPAAGSSRPVGELAREIVAVWGGGTIEVAPSASDPHEAGLLHLNWDKAQIQLGWQPRWGFQRAVSETVGWYRAVAGAGASALAVSRHQIASYQGTTHD